MRTAVIGCGPIGLLHAQAVAGSGHAALVAVCDVDAARRAEAGRQFNVPTYDNIETLLEAERPAVVMVATPDHLHVEPVLMAIASGCHVFCEKPLATTASLAQQLVSAARERGVHLGVDYNRRFAFGYRTAHELLKAGKLGSLQRCALQVSDRTPPAKVARNPYVMFTTLLTHHLDLLRFYSGEIRSIHADLGPCPVGNLMREVTLTLEFVESGTGQIVGRYQDNLTRTVEHLEIVADHGTIVVEEINRRVTLTSDGQTETFLPDVARGEHEFYTSVGEHVRAFVACLAHGAVPPVTGEDGLIGLRLAAAAIESIEIGRTIEVQR